MSTAPLTHRIDVHSGPTRCEGCEALWPCQGHDDAERARTAYSAARVDWVFGPEPHRADTARHRRAAR